MGLVLLMVIAVGVGFDSYNHQQTRLLNSKINQPLPNTSHTKPNLSNAEKPEQDHYNKITNK